MPNEKDVNEATKDIATIVQDTKIINEKETPLMHQFLKNYAEINNVQAIEKNSVKRMGIATHNYLVSNGYTVNCDIVALIEKKLYPSI